MQVEQMTPELVKLVSSEHYGYAGAEGWMDEKNDYKRPFFFFSEEFDFDLIVDVTGVSLYSAERPEEFYHNEKPLDLDAARRVVKALNGKPSEDVLEFVRLSFKRMEY